MAQLDRARLRSLVTLSVEVVDSIDSTNRALLEDLNSPDVLIARSQTAGRGRLGRRWVAPKDSALLMSISVDVASLPRERWAMLSLAMGLAAAKSSRSVGVPAMLKWPNDVIVNDESSPIGYRKLAGILAESAMVDGVARVVVGIGVNLVRPTDFDSAFDPGAVPAWMDDWTDSSFDATQFTADLLLNFGEETQALRTDPAAFLSKYRTQCATIGQSVRVDLGASELVGIATDIDNTGQLIVTTEAGQTTDTDSNGQLIVTTEAGQTTVSAGDVIHLRPAWPATELELGG